MCESDMPARFVRPQEEIQAMIVINKDGDVGFFLLHPIPNRLVALEKGLPVGIRLQIAFDRIANCRNMGASHAAD